MQIHIFISTIRKKEHERRFHLSSERHNNILSKEMKERREKYITYIY